MKKALSIAVVAVLLSTAICTGLVVRYPSALGVGKPDDPFLARSTVAAGDPSVRFNLSKYQYLDRAKLALLFGDSAEKKLLQNGFAVISGDNASFMNFNLAYEQYYEKDLPVFITTDTMLNVFHILYDDVLETYEQYILGPRLEIIVNALYNDSLELYNTPGFDRALAARLLTYFAVPCLIFNGSFVYPAELGAQVEPILEKIYSADTAEYFPGQDYTQYKPRGHYTDSPYLASYFRAMMWVQRSLFDLGQPSDVSTVWAISRLLDTDYAAWSSWDHMNDILGFLVGVSDPMNYTDVISALENLFGSSNLTLLNDTNVALLGRELQTGQYRHSRIVSYMELFPGSNQDKLPKTWSLLGQRYDLDAEVMQQVIYDWVPEYNDTLRALPSGLDVMAALGSEQAYKDLGEEEALYNYSGYLDAQRTRVGALGPDFWNASAYNILLDSYRTVVSDNGSSNPQRSLRSEEWKNEKLNTVLGSYAELKQDTLLNAAQPYGGGNCFYPEAYVEPCPRFYDRLADLCDRMLTMFQGLPINPQHQTILRIASNPAGPVSYDDFYYRDTFQNLHEICQKLAGISRDEIACRNLTRDQMDFIRQIVGTGVVGGCHPMPTLSGWLPALVWGIGKNVSGFDTKVVADICTASVPRTVKEAATGEVQTLLVLIELPNGTSFVAAGPVYSYYEFERPMTDRLTTDEWQSMLAADPPSRPEWAGDFMA